MSKLSAFFLFLAIYILSIIIIIPFVIFNNDPKIGDLLLIILTAMFGVEALVFVTIYATIKVAISILERR